MKRLLIYSVFLFTIAFYSCNESSISVFNVVLDEYQTEKSDSIVVNVDLEGDVIELLGTVEIIEGECHLLMRTPNNDTIYTQVFADQGKNKVSQQFMRMQGDWVLEYKLKHTGVTPPSGSLNLIVRYEN